MPMPIQPKARSAARIHHIELVGRFSFGLWSICCTKDCLPEQVDGEQDEDAPKQGLDTLKAGRRELGPHLVAHRAVVGDFLQFDAVEDDGGVGDDHQFGR